jgi:NADPH:quinone reductase-like Zn-dependent oxidoreductase
MSFTDGRGVDLVLHTRPGISFGPSLACLAPGGQLVQLAQPARPGHLDLRQFKPNQSLVLVDLEAQISESPALCQELLHEVCAEFVADRLQPLPQQLFPIGAAPAAFAAATAHQTLAAQVLTLAGETVLVAPPTVHAPRFHADATYLVTGGLTDSGLATAEWIVRRGGRYLVLLEQVGSTAVPPERIQALEQVGAQVLIVQIDLADEAQLADVLTGMRKLPPLRGIFHTAPVLDDRVLIQLDQEQFQQAIAPQFAGAWHLHTLTADCPLDFFVLYTSAPALFGSPSQGSSAAGSASLDALVQVRRSQGQPAQSINWGLWVMDSTASQRRGRLEMMGFKGVAPRQIGAVLDRLLNRPEPHWGVMALDTARLHAFHPDLVALPRFSAMFRRPDAEGPVADATERGIRDMLLTATPEECQRLLETYLDDQFGRITGQGQAQFNRQQPLTEIGFDSLMAIKLRDILKHDLQVNVPVSMLFQVTTVELINDLLAQLTIGIDGGIEGST